MSSSPQVSCVVRARFREEPCKTALSRVKNGMPVGWSLNPYMGCQHRCTFCYVRSFEKRADRPFGLAYGLSLRVKTNVVEVLRAEVTRRSWKRETVMIGSATDPYQPAEGSYRLTRGCIQVLSKAKTPFSLITRGPLIVRDIDVLQEASARVPVRVSLSIPTLDPEVWRKTEPGTAPPRQRLRALRLLVDAGIRAGVMVAPVLPGLSDRPEQIRAVIEAAREAGATQLWGQAVHLQPGTREYFIGKLQQDWPEQLPLYDRLYGVRDWPPAYYANPLAEQFRRLSDEAGIADRRLRPIEAPPPERQLGMFDG